MKLYRFHSDREIDQHNHLRAEGRALDQLLCELQDLHDRMAEIAAQSCQAMEAA